MELKQNHPGNYWHTCDPVVLYLDQSGENPPTQLIASRIGYAGVVQSPTVPIEVERLEFMAAGLFGPGRPCGWDSTTKWTGDCYKYGIYRYTDRTYRVSNSIVIIRTDGGGTHVYVDDDTTSVPLWDHLVATCSPERLWDICHLIAHTYERAHDTGRQEVLHAFLDGKLKKQRRNGRVRAYIEP